jgi:hypothetical protein
MVWSMRLMDFSKENNLKINYIYIYIYRVLNMN